MLRGPTFVIHMQGVIRVVVVIGILTMHDQMLPIPNLLRHRPRTEQNH